jgi:hypothetical protein
MNHTRFFFVLLVVKWLKFTNQRNVDPNTHWWVNTHIKKVSIANIISLW